MIGSIRGKILEKNAPEILIEAAGVGYEIFVPMTSFYELPGVNAEAFLYTAHIVKEDSETLFGFINKESKALFLELLKVSGIGPKTALAVLSAMTPEEFSKDVQEGKVQHITKIPGIGKKTAERLIIDMRDRIKELVSTASSTTIVPIDDVSHPEDPVEEQAVQAVISLGYKPEQASLMVHKAYKPNMSVEELIRAVLSAV